jgi:cytochrome b6-f complex iron-sulfur subunit
VSGPEGRSIAPRMLTADGEPGIVALMETRSDRRGVLLRLSQGLVGVLLTGGGVLAARFVQPPRVVDRSRRFSVAALATLPPGASLHVPDADAYVLHGPQGLFALSGKCTHLGCSLLRQAEGFSCPCHGARFDDLGRVLSGPAPRDLTWYAVRVEHGQILLHLDRAVAPGTTTRV